MSDGQEMMQRQHGRVPGQHTSIGIPLDMYLCVDCVWAGDQWEEEGVQYI